MISPDILKRSATASAFGAAVVGTVILMTPAFSDSDQRASIVEFGSTDTDREIHRSPEEDFQPVLRKAPPATAQPRLTGNAPDGQSADRAAVIDARNRAAQRALERLKTIYDKDAAPAQTQVGFLKGQIDRAVRRAADETHSSSTIDCQFKP